MTMTKPAHQPAASDELVKRGMKATYGREQGAAGPAITAENIILSATGAIYLVTEDTEAHIGRWVGFVPIRARSQRNYIAHVGSDSKQINARSMEALKRLVAEAVA